MTNALNFLEDSERTHLNIRDKQPVYSQNNSWEK